MSPEFANDPKHVDVIKKEWEQFQVRKGHWPRGHWHQRAAEERRPVWDFCPPHRDMPAFLASLDAPEPAPVAKPERDAKPDRASSRSSK